MEDRQDLVTHCIRFCRTLRQQGLLVGPNETSDSLRALATVDILDQQQVYWSLKSVLVSRADEIPIFDACFDAYWSFREPYASVPQPPRRKGILRTGNIAPAPVGLQPQSPGDQPAVQVVRTGASSTERSSARDLTGLGGDQMDEVFKIASKIARALPSRPGRRLRKHRRKGRPDLREALRRNLSHGFDLIDLPRRRKVPRHPRLLVLLDVSGSMDRYAELLLQVVYALGQRAGRVETFVFSTSLTKVTKEMRNPTFQGALQQVGDMVKHWSGGTCVGVSLKTLNAKFPELLDHDTSVILLSDGWDTGDPDDLGAELSKLRKRVRQIIWLNPLLGTPDYQPLTLGLRAARPHVDIFASARNLEQIKRLPTHLRW